MNARVFPIVIAALVLVAAACSGDDDQKATGLLEQDAVGWCLNIPADQAAEVSTLPKVPCDEVHTHEVFGVFESAEPTYPGFDALETEAQVGCLDRFEAYVGISPFDSELFYSWLVPTLASWSDQKIENSSDDPGDREIICIVGLAGDEEIGPDRLLRNSNL